MDQLYIVESINYPGDWQLTYGTSFTEATSRFCEYNEVNPELSPINTPSHQ